MPTPLENLQKSHKKIESDYYKNHNKKWQVELSEAKERLKVINDRLKDKTDPKYDKLIEAKNLLEEKIENILKLEIPSEVEDSYREAEAARLEANIEIAKEKFKGDPKADPDGYKKFQLDKIKRLFENGVDTIITHGNDTRDPKTREATYDKNGTKRMSAGTDQDAKTAILYLELAKTNKKYGPTMQEVAGSENTGIQSASFGFVPKGESYKPTKEDWGKVFLHVDTSGREGVSMNFDDKSETVHIYVDHHIAALTKNTSAGQQVLELLKKIDLIKPEPWMEAYAKFNTEYDNFTFDIDRDHLIKNYWKTPRGLMKVIPQDQFIQFFKDGRNPDVPFTDEELDTIKVNGRLLRKIANGQKTHMEKSRELVANGEIEAIIEGVTSYTDELGIISFNTVETEIDEEGNVKDTKNAAEGGVVAKALGIPTFIKFWKNGGGFFMTSTRDLTPLFERIKDRIPGLKLVRGKMLIYAQPNQLKPNELDEVITRKVLDEEKTKKAGGNVYKIEKFIKSKNPKEFEAIKNKFIDNKEVFQNYYVQKNRQHLDKEKMLEIMGLVEKNNYEDLPEPKLERAQRLLKIRLEEAEASKDTERIRKVQKALGLIETAYSKVAPEKEPTPEEITALLENVRGSITLAQETRATLASDIAVLKETITEYEKLIDEEEIDDDTSTTVKTPAKNKTTKTAPKAKPSLTFNPDAKADSVAEKEADLKALDNLEIGKPVVYKNADGNFIYKNVNAISKGGKIRFEGETAWISTDTIKEWVKEKHATGTNPDATKEPMKTPEPEIESEEHKGEFASILRELDWKLQRPQDDVLSELQKKYPNFNKRAREIKELYLKEMKDWENEFYKKESEILKMDNGVYIKEKNEQEELYKQLKEEDRIKTQAIKDRYEEGIKSLGTITEEDKKISSTSAEEIYNSWDKSDIETFKIYQSGIMIGEKKGAKEKVFAINKKTNEVLPLEEGWSFATKGGQKDFEYFYGELFDVKSIRSIKDLKYSDFDITPAKMNPDGTLKEKGKITIKK